MFRLSQKGKFTVACVFAFSITNLEFGLLMSLFYRERKRNWVSKGMTHVPCRFFFQLKFLISNLLVVVAVVVQVPAQYFFSHVLFTRGVDRGVWKRSCQPQLGSCILGSAPVSSDSMNSSKGMHGISFPTTDNWLNQLNPFERFKTDNCKTRARKIGVLVARDARCKWIVCETNSAEPATILVHARGPHACPSKSKRATWRKSN